MSDSLTADDAARGAHRFECEGFVATDQTLALRFAFHVFVDGALTVEVAPAAAQHASADPLCYAYDGRAALRAVPSADQVDPTVFQCSFKLLRFWRHQLQSQFMVCHASLSASNGLQGHYVVVHGDDDDRPHAREVALPVTLRLLPTTHTHEPLAVPMLPLTPGTYKLTGYTVTTSGTVYECIVELQLHGDGTLVGTSHDLLFPQQSALRGKWSQAEVTYSLEYKFGASSSQYLYTMKPSLGGLRGRWAHEDAVRSQRPTERGHVELLLNSASRLWSTSFHKLYPRVFQHIAKLLLLRAARSPVQSAHTLPSALWQHVLSFCDFHHFPQEVPTTN